MQATWFTTDLCQAQIMFPFVPCTFSAQLVVSKLPLILILMYTNDSLSHTELSPSYDVRLDTWPSTFCLYKKHTSRYADERKN